MSVAANLALYASIKDEARRASEFDERLGETIRKEREEHSRLMEEQNRKLQEEMKERKLNLLETYKKERETMKILVSIEEGKTKQVYLKKKIWIMRAKGVYQDSTTEFQIWFKDELSARNIYDKILNKYKSSCSVNAFILEMNNTGRYISPDWFHGENRFRDIHSINEYEPDQLIEFQAAWDRNFDNHY